MLHYYIQKGWDADKFLSLDTDSRLFYMASMVTAMEEKRAAIDALLGGAG